MDLKPAVIIQARMSSRRLPGKVLRLLDGKPLLAHLIDRISRCDGVQPPVVATSTDVLDNEIEEFCRKNAIRCYRGVLENVAARFAGAIKQFNISAFIRANADSPLLDPEVVRTGLSHFYRGHWDIVTNTFKRSYPKGQSVEILNSDVFLKAVAGLKDDFEREHITQHFYRNPDKYRIFNFECPEGNYAAENLSVDIEEDFQLCEKLLTEESISGKTTWQTLLKTKARLLAKNAR